MKKNRNFWMSLIIPIVVSLAINAIYWGISEQKIKNLNDALEQTEMVQNMQNFSENKGKLQCIKDLYLSGVITKVDAMEQAVYVVRNVEEDFEHKVNQAYEQHIERYPELNGDAVTFINIAINELEEIIEQLESSF